MNHKDLRKHIHPPYTHSVADAAALAALTGFEDAPFSACDVGRVVRQASDESLWRLISVSPVTWKQDNGGGSGSSIPAPHAASHLPGGSDELEFTPAMLGAEPVIGTKKTAFNCDFGTTAGTVCAGNDARLVAAKVGQELLSAPVSSSATTSTEVFRKTLTMVAGEVLHFLVTTTSTAAVVTNSRRIQVGYRGLDGLFASLGQYVVNSASSGSMRQMALQCVSVNGDGTSTYRFWGAVGATVPITFTASSSLILQFNAWVDVGGDSSTINSIVMFQALR